MSLTRGFYLGKYEVTQAQYEAVMSGNTDGLNAKPSNWPNNPNRPVENVSWSNAQVFLTRLNEQQAGNLPAGWSYVLPTESQWEYACRAGTTTMFSWGNDINATLANYVVSGLNQTRDVGYYAANPWGFLTCMEMSGSGRRTGSRRPIPQATRLLIQQALFRVRLGSGEVVPITATGRTCVRLSATAATPAPVPTAASVLVSKKASKEEARKVLNQAGRKPCGVK